MNMIIGILVVIGGIVFIHELGHFTFAKLTGMRVETFSLGFPPRLFGKKIGETDYCISAIPLGGYIKVSGVIDESMDVKGASNIDDPKSFASKNTLQKSLFITGGVLFNFLLSIVVFTLLTLSSGIYEPIYEPVVDQVIPGFPADSCGIQAGDRILSVNETAITDWNEMTEIVHAHPADSILLEWESSGQIYQKKLLTKSNKIFKDNEFVEVGLIGISPQYDKRAASISEAARAGCSQTWYWIKITAFSLKALLTGQESLKNVGGPILIAKMAGESAKSGFSALFGLLAIISVNLGLLNILPIPALDGGHLVVILIEGIIRKPLSDKIKIRIQQVGMAILLTLIVVVLFNDVVRLFNGF